jgi:ABC-2 type transport system ATP-binding protein
VEGTPGETVIEAKSLTKNSAISPPPTTSILPSSAARFSACSARTAREIHHL